MESNTVYSLTPKFQRLKDQTPEAVRDFLRRRYEERVAKSGAAMVWDPHCTDILDEVVAWLGTPQKTGLLLFGSYGTGKTTMLSCVEDLFRKEYFDRDQVQRCYPGEIIDALKSNQRAAPLAELRQVAVLLIDEAGTEPSVSTIWGDRCTPIRDIIIARYDYMKTTVIATNLDCEEFLRQYGERVMDRITEAYTSIYFSGDSYRRRSLGR